MNKNIIGKIGKLFSEWDGKDTPGFAVGILRRGKILYSRGYGMASLEHAVPITPKTIFDIGSTSKQFVAFCVALLERSGKISLEDDVRKHIPEMRKYGKSVRLHHLLHHTSGIRDYLALMELAGMRYENEYPDEQVLGLITRQRNLNFIPGEEFIYSNSGYLLLGEIVKRVSGLSLREFAEKNIFSPLGMHSTHFHDDYTRIVKNKASGYSASDTGFKLDISLFDVVGDGGVNTSVEDLAKWDANFYSNRLAGGQELIKRITTPGRLNDGRKLEYAHGLFVADYRGQNVISHGGAWVGYRSDLMRFPENELTIVCLSNLIQTKPTYLSKRIADICLKDILIGPPTPLKPCRADRRGGVKSGPAPRVGAYLNGSGDGFIEIERVEKKYILRDDESRYDLYSLGAGRYTVATGSREIQVDKASNGGQRIILKKLNAAPVEYRIVDPKHAGRDSTAGFRGRYYSEELAAEYAVSRKGAKVFLERPGAASEDLHRIAKGILAGKYVFLNMQKNQGTSCFLLNYCRVRGIVFRKVLNNSSGRPK